MANLLSLFTTSLILLCECYAQFSAQCNFKPSINFMTDNSDIVVKGAVLRKLEELTTAENTYTIDVVVTEVYKGYKTFGNISSIALSAPNSDVPNVYRFGNFRLGPCLTEVRPHAEYIFFLTTGRSSPVLNPAIGGLEGQESKEVTPNQDEGRIQLQPQYNQGVTDPVEEFSVNREKMILMKLGWSTWGSWSPCSDPCGGTGTQSRKRTCDKDFADACEGAVKEVRECNLFGCGQMKNLLEIMNLQDRPTGVRHPKNRHSAYRITSEASITIPTSMIYTHVFPDEFSILLSLKPRPSGSLDNSNLYAVVMVGPQRDLQLAIHIGRHPTVLYHTPYGRREIVFEGYTITRDWHSIAFGIRRNSVTMVADCSYEKIKNLPVGDEISIGTDGFTSIGSPSGGVDGISDITFSGDIDQFVILPDPAAASLQCSSQERMLPLPPEDLFDYYPVRDPDSADVPFDIDPAQVNPSLDISTTPSTVRIPTTPSTTDNIFQSTPIPSPSTTEPSGKVTEKPDFIDDENAIPPVNIIPNGVEPDIIVIPSRGDHPDIIVDPEVIRLPSSIEPEAERSIKQTTKAPKIPAPEGPERNHDERQIKGSPANIPLKVTDMRPGEGAYPPGDGYLRDNGDLFDDASSGDDAYNEGGVEWSTWSTCSTTCGLGTRYRFGFCQKDSTHLDCRRGHTITAQRKSCKLHNCEGVMQWSDWSACSRTCGENSVRTRMAFCPDERAHEDCIRPGQTVVERKSCDVPACSDVCAEECQNDGECRNGECVCPPGYSGQSCQHQTCSPQCRNGGVCLSNNVCQCPDGTLPPYCTRRCTPDCQNGGTCSTGNRCHCPEGYSGFRCETPICTSSCQNGGRCVGPDKCQCTSGYGGTDCSKAQCLLGCENGGTCIRPDYCRCPPAYRGSRCEIGYCRERCRNGGTCIGADTCKCTRGYTGAFCKRSKCPRGCPPSMTCVGHNRCIPKSFASRGTKHSSAGRKTWCPLTSFSQQIKTSYVKPVIRNIRISCGPFGLQSCNSQRLAYTIAYRTTYKTSYRCANRG